MTDRPAVDHGATDEDSHPTFRAIALIAGPAAAIAVWIAPFPGIPPAAHSLAAILSCVVIYWITEPIPLPVTALLGTAACVLAGLGSAKSLFAAYGHPIIFLFIGSFLLAEAMAVHGVDRRVACWMLCLRWVDARPSRILLALGAATGLISMWISNTAAAALMLPVALGVLGTLRESGAEGLRSYRIGLLLMLSYAATAGGVATIIGTPPNLIGAGLIAEQLHRTISFVEWMLIGMPLACLLLAAAWLLLWKMHPAAVHRLPGLDEFVMRQRHELGPWTRGEINSAIAFVVAITLWVGPGILGAALGDTDPLVAWLDTRLPNELVALLAAGLLFVLPIDWRSGAFTLSWKQATGINWGIILLFGGGLAFGDLMVQTKLSTVLGEAFITVFGMETVWGLTGIAVIAGVIVSELASNTASASLLVPLAIGIAEAAAVSPIPPALGATLGASLGFALPVSTPPNAIVYGTNLIPMRRMVMAGLLFDVIGTAVIWSGLRLFCPLIGLV